jgi:hypothetical protein
MAERIVDLSELLANAPRNCWLALNEEETKIVGRGETIQEAVKEAKEAGVSDPIVVWSRKEWVASVF